MGRLVLSISKMDETPRGEFLFLMEPVPLDAHSLLGAKTTKGETAAGGATTMDLITFTRTVVTSFIERDSRMKALITDEATVFISFFLYFTKLYVQLELHC